MLKVTPLLLGLLVGLAGCNTETPYPNLSPIAGARVSANPNERGTPAFCRQYARQTAGNQYENLVDRGEDGFGVRALQRQSAIADGDRAYRNCLAGRTG
ncbi:MAG: hypothetical protein V7704_19865 [Aurantimonas endophytica]|uniref:Lipoprotein n=1 Tax=Aurantimonas endophytica TaxID=1522175 RepID=A0A7W6MP41_9HYPH|nr:hypothetical protein [Aurantimonas endophytica]MBB4002540.1 hypothetical protein [Aurantimonas endophytica]MCO6403421.1 hypothetical protein [Aurantimonas endophytica]